MFGLLQQLFLKMKAGKFGSSFSNQSLEPLSDAPEKDIVRTMDLLEAIDKHLNFGASPALRRTLGYARICIVRKQCHDPGKMLYYLSREKQNAGAPIDLINAVSAALRDLAPDTWIE